MKQPKLTISTEADREKNEITLWGLFSQEVKEKDYKKAKTYMKSGGTSGLGSSQSKPSKAPITTVLCNHYTDMILKIKKRTLQEVIEKFKHDSQLKVILAYLALTYNPTPSASLLHLIGMDQSGTSLKLAALKLREKLQKNIDDFFNQNRGRVLDLQTFIELEAISSEFVKLVHANGQKNVNFWVAYCEPQIQVKELYFRSKEIETESELIQALWRRHTAKHKIFAKSLGSVYGMYLSVVRNTPYLAHKTLQKNWVNNMGQMMEYENNDEPLSESTLLSSNVLSFSASMTREKPGKVMHVSPHIVESLGWSTNEVVGQNISSVMPHFMRDRHDQMLIQHMRSSIDNTAVSRMYKNIDTFILEKSGNILPCEVYISIHPTITQIPTYISLVKVKRTQGDQILFNDMGMIEGFTRNVGKLFGLKTDERSLLPNICKNYNEIEQIIQKARPRKSVMTPLKQLEKGKMNDSFLADVNENDATDLELEFYIGDGNDKKSQTRETQVYSGTITPYYYVNACYYVLTLDQQIVKESEEKYKIKSTMTAPPNFLTQGSYLPQSTLGPNDLDETGRMSDIGDEKSNKNTHQLPLFQNTPPPQKKVNHFKKVSAISNEIPDERVILTTNAPILYEETNYRAFSASSQKDLDQILTTMNDQKEPRDSIPVKSSMTLHAQDDSGEPSWKNRKPTFGFGREPSKIGGPFQPPPEWEAEEEKKNPALKIVDLNTRAASSVGSSFKAEMVKLEQAVNVVPRNSKLSMLNLILIAFTFLLTGPLVGYQLQSYNIIGLIEGSVQVLSKSIFRLVRLTDIFQYSRLLLLSNNGLFEQGRYYPYGYTDTVSAILLDSLDEITNDINTRNNELRAFVYQLDSKLQKELYQDEIPIIEMNDQGVTALSGRTAKVFDLITEVVTMGTEILTSSLPFNSANPYIMFCLNNTYNQLLVSSEKTVNILISDNESKLDQQLQYIIYSMVALGLAGLFVLGFFYNLVKKFVVDRNQFISILLTLDRNHIQTQIYMVQKFVNTLEKSGMDGKRINLVDSLDNYTNYATKKTKDGKDSKFRKKVANTGGINGILSTLYMSMVALLLAMYSAFPVLLIATDSGNQGILTKMNLLVKSNLNLYNINSLANTIYEYVAENITTYTRNKPIKEDFEETFQEMTYAQDFVLYDLLDTKSGVGDSEQLRAMALGSLCDNIQTGDENLKRQCKTMGGGVCEKGIVGLNSYILSALKGTKDSFDASPRQWADMKKALAMTPLIDMEVFYPFTYQAFVWIDDLLKEHLGVDFNSFRTLILNVVVSYIVCYFIVGGLIWQKIKTRLEKEMAGWRRMMRLIPQASIVVNKRLRRYLAKNSDGILDAK